MDDLLRSIIRYAKVESVSDAAATVGKKVNFVT